MSAGMLFMAVTQLRARGRKLLSGSPKALQNGRAALTPGSTSEALRAGFIDVTCVIKLSFFFLPFMGNAPF